MSYKVETITNFRKEAKKLIQKYPSLTTEIENIGIFTDPVPVVPSALGELPVKLFSRTPSLTSSFIVSVAVFISYIRPATG
jgi:hypothetical protein